ncbi:MAG: hypothetical protein KAG53_08180 [Endozoicomonadaceae bacterium]|nr:hypothetical protein [Endozoicomonadaceae bacterium]
MSPGAGSDEGFCRVDESVTSAFSLRVVVVPLPRHCFHDYLLNRYTSAPIRQGSDDVPLALFSCLGRLL